MDDAAIEGLGFYLESKVNLLLDQLEVDYEVRRELKAPELKVRDEAGVWSSL